MEIRDKVYVFGARSRNLNGSGYAQSLRIALAVHIDTFEQLEVVERFLAERKGVERLTRDEVEELLVRLRPHLRYDGWEAVQRAARCDGDLRRALRRTRQLVLRRRPERRQVRDA
jgi:hypothetical protein